MANDELRELYEFGCELYDKKKYSEAKPVLQEVIKRNPRYADVLNKLGVIHHLQGELEEAAFCFERSITINPSYSEAILNLTITYNEMGKTDRAYDLVQRMNARNKPDADSGLDPFVSGKLANEHYKLGNIYMDLARYDDAIDQYRRALTLKPGLADIQTKLGMCLRELGHTDDAITELSRAKADNPYYGPARIQLGLTYYMQGSTGIAYEEWEEALRLLPKLKEAESFINMLRQKGELPDGKS